VVVALCQVIDKEKRIECGENEYEKIVVTKEDVSHAPYLRRAV